MLTSFELFPLLLVKRLASGESSLDHYRPVGPLRRHTPGHISRNKRVGESVGGRHIDFVRQRKPNRIIIVKSVGRVVEGINIIRPPFLTLGGVGHSSSSVVEIGAEKEIELRSQCRRAVCLNDIHCVTGFNGVRISANVVHDGDAAQVGNAARNGPACQQCLIRDWRGYKLCQTRLFQWHESFEIELVFRVGLSGHRWRASQPKRSRRE